MGSVKEPSNYHLEVRHIAGSTKLPMQIKTQAVLKGI